MDLIKHAPSSLNLKDLKENKLYILSEMCELIDDEETLVKIEAVKVLPIILQLYTQEEIAQSKIIETLKNYY